MALFSRESRRSPKSTEQRFRIDGVERAAYNFGRGTNAPFLFPIVGPSGALLTRLGRPAPNGRKPERSVWLGHNNLAGSDFWHDQPETDVKIRHREICRYSEGPGPRAGLTIKLDWWAKGRAVLHQILELVMTPTKDRGFVLDIATRFESTGSPVELGQTELGFLGVRVAKTMSECFGGGRAVGSEGLTGASAISGTTGRWVDYSGPSAPGTVEGICILDHPTNPGHPTHWGVEPDGLMCRGVQHGVSARCGPPPSPRPAVSPLDPRRRGRTIVTRQGLGGLRPRNSTPRDGLSQAVHPLSCLDRQDRVER